MKPVCTSGRWAVVVFSVAFSSSARTLKTVTWPGSRNDLRTCFHKYRQNFVTIVSLESRIDQMLYEWQKGGWVDQASHADSSAIPLRLGLKRLSRTARPRHPDTTVKSHSSAALCPCPFILESHAGRHQLAESPMHPKMPIESSKFTTPLPTP